MECKSAAVKLFIVALNAHFRSCGVMMFAAHIGHSCPAVAATACVKRCRLQKMDLSPWLRVEFTKVKKSGQTPLFCQALTNPAHFPAGEPGELWQS